MKKTSILVFACILFGVAHAAQADNVVVGVNTYTEQALTQKEQDMELTQMAENGVKTIRTGLQGYNIYFIIKAYQHGIGAVVIVSPTSGSAAKPQRKSALSDGDPQRFTETVKPLLDKLEAAGVHLVAFELGNEINTSRFNSDIADPGSGRELGVADLNNPNDSEGKAVASGYRTYLKVMAALKDLCDRSRLNQQTPIISAGLTASGLPSPKSQTNKLDVSFRDTLEFLRQNGMDKLVDGYGVHVYPDADPRRPVSARISSLEENVFSACSKAKPCWMGSLQNLRDIVR